MADPKPRSATSSLGRPDPTDWFVMSLTQGWDQIAPEQGGRSLTAGDLVVLVVATHPDQPVICPPGWTQNGGHAFWKTIGPGELNPMFRCRRPVMWAVEGRAYTGLTVLPEGWQTTRPRRLLMAKDIPGWLAKQLLDGIPTGPVEVKLITGTPQVRYAVLAGSYAEFDWWCREQGFGPNSGPAFLVDSWHDLRGRRDLALVRVGTWLDRRDLDQIEDVIAARKAAGAIVSDVRDG